MNVIIIFYCYSIEGVVVAKEFQDKLLDAWRRDEEEQERKEQEVRNISDCVVFIQVINPFVQRYFFHAKTFFYQTLNNISASFE